MKIVEWLVQETSLAPLRLVNRHFACLIERHANKFLVALFRVHPVAPATLTLFDDGGNEKGQDEATAGIRRLLHLHAHIRAAQTLARETRDWNSGIQPSPRVTFCGQALVARADSFLIFAAFHDVLRTAELHSVSPAPSYALARRPSIAIAVCNQACDDWTTKWMSLQLLDFIQERLSLEQLESLLSTIRISEVCLERTFLSASPAALKYGATIYGSGFGTESQRDMMDEHILWRGPRWLALALTVTKRGPELNTGRHDGVMDFFKGLPWRGYWFNAIDCIASGLYQLLCAERMRKVNVRRNTFERQA